MIRIGILNKSQIGVEYIQKIQQFKEFKISGSLNPEECEKSQYAKESLLENSEAVYIAHNGTLEKDFLKMILRKSKNIFLQQAFFSKLTDIKELISLQQEAECIVQINNPYLFTSDVLKISSTLEKPQLTEISINLEEKGKLEFELLNVLLYLSKTDNSGYRKIDVFALQGEKHFLLNLHMQFISGSVAQLNIYMGEKSKSSCKVSIFQKDKVPVNIEITNSETQVSASEKNSLKEFIKSHKNKDATTLSLNDLHLALSALHEIKEKLKYPNISLSN
ncbi:hypothetical protein ACUNWD_19340 [Sunxiuqinia sp. A32]|uniref:hypothetical protein n=1 Tax=Sunxiuqinia sp. A32 TaxID=3461496 RepID=UPI004045FE0D